MNPIHPVYRETSLHGGEQKLYRFGNDYGASVIKHAMSYGSNEGLWELAVLTWRGNSFALDYTSPITDDVIGNLTLEEVEEILTHIMALTPNQVLH